MSCKKIYNLEMVVIMEEEFATVEEAANQKMPSTKAFVSRVSDMKLINSLVKKKEDNDGKHQKSSAGTDGQTEGKK